MRAGSLNQKVETIYFGGGTPSILEHADLKNILAEIERNYDLTDDIEITLEANPEHISESGSKKLMDSGVNRVSLGIQSFNSSVLKTLGRNHNRKKAIESLEILRESGINNISFDLIMGVPGQSLEDFESDLELALEIMPEHISVYALTIEEGTPMEHAIKTGKLEAPSDNMQAAMYKLCYQSLTKPGYEAYEISNYALPGYRSKHNSAYWDGSSFLGFGPSAHSMINHQRSHNPADLKEYLRKINKNELSLNEEPMSHSNHLNEYILTQLRLDKGISFSQLSERFGEKEAKNLRRKSEVYLSQRLLMLEDDRLYLSLEGRLMADRIAMDLFAEEDES